MQFGGIVRMEPGRRIRVAKEILTETKDRPAKAFVWMSIILGIASIGVGIYLVVKGEYVLGTSMIVGVGSWWGLS